MTRQFSSTSVATTLSAGINSTATSMVVATGTGSALMGGVTLGAGNVDSFGIALDVDTQNEEVVWVTAVSGDTLTIVRAKAGTSGIAHTAGASVKHVFTGDDATFFTTGTATANAAIPKALVTAKGDLVGATASGVPDNLAVGSNGQILTADSAEAMGVKWSTPTTLSLTINAQTGTTYTIVSGDINKLVTLNNASAITVTIPNGVFTTGQQVNFQQLAAGQVTFASDGTTTFTGTGTKLRAQYSASTLVCTGTNTFTLIGDIA
tara:strand:+ start:1846 stop:2637 length:792 start_codon:yes stop_codon:yes gene_type:complete